MDSARPPRLLVVGLSWPLETFLRRLLVGLAESGMEVSVASPERPDDMPVQWISVPSWSGPAPVRLLRSAVNAGMAWARSPAEAKLLLGSDTSGDVGQRARAQHDLAPLVGRNWDVLYFPWNSAAAAHLQLFELGKPVVVSCRGSQILVAPTNPRRAKDVQQYYRALNQATTVHCVSDSVRLSVEGKGIRSRKSWVNPPGIDTEEFAPSDHRDEQEGPVRLISVGNLSWVKGQEFLFGALRMLRASEDRFHLRVIGDGPERQRVLYTIRDLGLGDSVDLLGRLDEAQVKDELRRSDIFVLSSLSEGISNAALEAMSCGLPVVSTNVGGMAEAIRDGVEGRLVPPRDPEAMAEALAQLGRDRQLRLQMGAAARDKVVSQFSLERHIAAWRELLDEVLQRHRVGAMP